MFYIKNMARSIKEKPFTYLIYTLTILVCVITTCIFYRMTKQQLSFVQSGNGSMSSLITPIVMGVLVIIITSINIFVAYDYLSAKNIYNITIYKMVGAKNIVVIFALFLETVLVLIIAFFIALIIEYQIAKPIIGFVFSTLKVMDYLYIFLINMLSVFLTLAYKVIKIACSPATTSKLSGVTK